MSTAEVGRSGLRPLSRFGLKVIAGIAAIAIAFVGLVLGNEAAYAAGPEGVSVQVQHNGKVLDGVGTPEFRNGDALKMQMQYDSRAQGQSVELLLGEGVAFDATYPKNDAIESILPNTAGTGVIVKFKDAPYIVPQGILSFDLVLDEITTSNEGTVSWGIGEIDTSVPVIFVKEGESRESVSNGFGKNPAPRDLNSFVKLGVDGIYEGLDATIADATIEYTLTIDTDRDTTRDAGFSVKDVLPKGLEFVAPLTVNVQETTWDASGYVPATADRADFNIASETASEFSGEFANPIEGPSMITMTYLVRVADVDALSQDIEKSFLKLDGKPGYYGTTLTNTATFGGNTPVEANVDIGGTVVGPCLNCGGFAKADDFTTVYAHTDEAGVLDEPINVTYSLAASFAQWDGHSDNFKLKDNVIVTDDLLPQAEWKLPEPLSVTGLYDNSGNAIPELTQISCVSDADFAKDENLGTYCLDGNTFKANLGKFHNQNTDAPLFTDVKMNLPAVITSVKGLDTVGGTTDGVRYLVRNTATFNIDGDKFKTPNVDGNIVVPDADRENAVNDPSAFAKTGPKSVTAPQNSSVTVPYTFTVDTAQAGVPAGSVRIVDHVDTSVFDLGENLSNVSVAVSYSKASEVLSSDDLVVTRNGDDLEIAFVEASKAKVSAPNGKLEIILTLQTRVLEGKETIDLTNSADLFGDGSEPYYTSSFNSRGTSFGAESETRKHIFEGGKWIQLMAPEYDAEELYVYRLQFIGHNGFGGVTITDEFDELPAGLEFVGFVHEDDIATGEITPGNEFDPQTGNLIARFDENTGPSGRITLSQKTNTEFPSGETVSVYYAAKITDREQAVVNTFGSASTTILPDGPSVDIEKWTTEGANSGPAYDALGNLLNDGYEGDFDEKPGKPLKANAELKVNFTISNDGPEDLKNIVVSDQLTDGKGEIEGLVCTFPDTSTGVEWAGPLLVGEQFNCEGSLPALEAGDTHANLASVEAVGNLTGKKVSDEDLWNAYVPVPSIDIEKWNDEGETPEYDASGALLNDGFAGDFDGDLSKSLKADKAQPIRFTISNDGNERLTNIVVSDELAAGAHGEITDLECVFPDDSKGTKWDGPFEIGAQFECTGTVPGLAAGQMHKDTATVTADGEFSGLPVENEDSWSGKVPALAVTGGDSLAITGQDAPIIAGVLALLAALGGTALVLNRRKARTL